MPEQKRKRMDLGTAGIVAVAIFLLAWNLVEHITGTEPKSAPPGTTYQAAQRAGATVTPTPSDL
jgi:hypothetical protein